MVVDTLENLGKYASLHPLFARAVEFLKSTDLSAVESGSKVELEGKDLVAIFAQTRPKAKKEAKLEAHRKYIDIQLPLSGTEVIGYTPLRDCMPADSAYDEENDIRFFEGAAETYLAVKPGMFTVFFPEDAHAPGIAENGVKKVIVKVLA